MKEKKDYRKENPTKNQIETASLRHGPNDKTCLKNKTEGPEARKREAKRPEQSKQGATADVLRRTQPVRAVCHNYKSDA